MARFNIDDFENLFAGHDFSGLPERPADQRERRSTAFEESANQPTARDLAVEKIAASDTMLSSIDQLLNVA